MSYQQQIDAAFTTIRQLEKRIEELEQLGPLLHAVIGELQTTRQELHETRSLVGEVRRLDG